MANATSIVILETRPLVTSDADALTAPIQAVPFYQPAFIAETFVDAAGEIPMPTALTGVGEVWRVIFELASPMPDFVVYPYAFTGNLHASTGTVAFASLFETLAQFQISVDPSLASTRGWREFSLGSSHVLGSIGGASIDIAPDLKGFPVRPRTPGGGGLGTRVGEMLLEIKTPDVTVTAATVLNMDFRLLLFPVSSALNAGFYTPSLFFHTN